MSLFKRASSSNKVPTPADFVAFILSQAEAEGGLNVNVHFVPQWSLCPFCTIDFDFVGKVEDFEAESNYVIQRLKLGVNNIRIKG